MNSIVHIVPGISDVSNGMAVVARLLAKEHGGAGVVDLKDGVSAIARSDVEEVWVHGMWLPKEWLACLKAIRCGKRLVRMTHGSLSPIYLQHQSPLKKRLASPIERHLIRKADKVVATCDAEAGWIRDYLGTRCPPVEVTDIKRFFNLPSVPCSPIPALTATALATAVPRPLHLLYLGRRHPLKGLEYLEAAVAEQTGPQSPVPGSLQLKVVSNAFGDELEQVWDWCDVLILPTLSDNFGLVIAEALERGKRVITTDGAPAWGDGSDYGGRLTYLRGYRDGTPEERVRLLSESLRCVILPRQ